MIFHVSSSKCLCGSGREPRWKVYFNPSRPGEDIPERCRNQSGDEGMSSQFTGTLRDFGDRRLPFKAQYTLSQRGLTIASLQFVKSLQMTAVKITLTEHPTIGSLARQCPDEREYMRIVSSPAGNPLLPRPNLSEITTSSLQQRIRIPR